MNKLIIASAGSGKTRFVVNDAIDKASQGMNVLITTFTEACEQEIRDRLVEKEGCIPERIFVQTWFSFLISHGVKPYQGSLFDFDVKGMLLVNGKSGLRCKSKDGIPVYWGEDNFDKCYFTDSKKVYSDKLAKLVIKCNQASDGMVFDRISRCFKWIYVDEIQDLAGYDLEVLDCLFNSNVDVLLVGDPRQATYATHNSRKNKKYVKSEIVNFFEDSKIDIETDTTSLTINHRCFESICNLSNKLYPALPQATSGNIEITGHDGVFALPVEHVSEYLSRFTPIQLRDSVKTPVSDDFEVLNFGKSKGLTLDRVVIYPSKPMVDWLKDKDAELTQAARAKLYVALTRARHSVAIVLKSSDLKNIDGIEAYRP
ncbi:MAG: UvrD-helicase domain-containing protein [Sideroxydans sp.]|nr:UvrD-helicase domain-containing protein [Sideroxydans sp.]